MPLRRRWRLGALVLVAAALASGPPPVEAAEGNPTTAVLAVHRPGDVSGDYMGFFATFSAFPLPKDDLVMRTPKDPLGCVDYGAEVAQPASWVAIVRRGECTFLKKALNAKAAGAKGVIIVSDSQSVQIMGLGNDTSVEAPADIFALGVDKKLGDRFFSSLEAGEEPALTVTPYVNSLMNVSEVILICLATLLVALGAFFSTADVAVAAHKSARPGASGQSFHASLAPEEDEVMEVDQMTAVGFCVVGSCMLVFLFYFMHYAIYFIMFCFCLGGVSCMSQFGAICLNHFFPSLRNKSAVNIPQFGPVSHAEMIAFLPSLAVVISWVVLRKTAYGWVFQDVIGAGFLCWLQRTLRLQNMQVASLLLSIMFFFDIFWVFISPLFFHESVMVRVATGGGTGEAVPMLLRIPTFGDPFGGDRMLGFGDIALPGLLISYLRRYDLMCGRKPFQGYFGPALVGYFVGLNVTIAALCIMRMGQPALLYLVPGTLGTTLVLASCRDEFWELMNGEPLAQVLDDDVESSSSVAE